MFTEKKETENAESACGWGLVPSQSQDLVPKEGPDPPVSTGLEAEVRGMENGYCVS